MKSLTLGETRHDEERIPGGAAGSEMAGSEMEAQFQATFEQAAVGIAHVAPDGHWLRVNQKHCDIVGYSREELLQRSFQDITHPDDLDTDLDQVRRMLAGEITTYSMEKRYIRKDRNIVWVFLTVSLLREPSGKPIHFISVVEDITGRKTAEQTALAANQQLRAANQQLRATEQQLRASNQQLRATEQQLCASNQQLRASLVQLSEAQSIARLGSWEWDAINDVIIGSSEFYRLFGVDAGQMPTLQSFLELLHPDDRERVSRDVRESIVKNTLFNTEYRVTMPDASVRHILARGRLLIDDSGMPRRLAGTCLDITDRIQADEALRESEARFRHVFQSANVGKSITLPSGEIAVNQAFCEMLGYSPGELQHKTWQELTPADEIETVQKALEPLLDGRMDSTRFNKSYIHKSGAFVLADLSVAILRDTTGKPLHFITTVVDITERRKTEQDLEASEARYRRLFESARDGILILDAEDGRIIDVNPFLVELTGYPQEHFLSKYLWDIGPLQDALASRVSFEELKAEKYIRYEDLPLKTADGRLIDVEFVSNEYSVDNREVIQCNIRDITERRRAEELLRASETRFRDSVRYLEEGFYSVTLDGILIDHNIAFNRIFGIAPEQDSRGILLPDFWQEPGDRAVYIEELLRTGVIRDYLVHAKTGAGEHLVIQANSHLVKDQAGCPVRIDGTISNISERVRLYEALRQSEEKFSRVFYTAPYAITITHPSDGRFLDVNDAFTEITGYSREEALADSSIGLRLWVDEADRNRVVATLASGGQVYGEEFRFRTRQGMLITGLFSAQVLQLGEESCILSSINDITHRKQTEEDLQRNQAMLARTERIASIGSWEWDVATDTVSWSDELFHIFGLDPGNGAPSFAEHTKLYHPDDMQRLREAVEEAIAHGTPYELELRAICRDGETRICLARGFAEQGPDGGMIRLFGSCQDITDRRNMENEHKAREVSYRELFENMHSCVAIYEVIYEGRDFILRDFNRAGEMMDGQRREDLIGRSIFEAWPGVRKFGLPDVLRRVWTTGIPEHFPTKQYQDDRLDKWYDNTVYRLPDGKVVALYEDITERVRAQEDRDSLQAQLIQVQKMESVGQLAGGVAHDFNNMLGVILGRAEMALEQADPAGPIAANLLEIRKAAERSADLTRQLLAFARKQIISPKVLDLNDTVTGMLRMLHRLIGENIQLTLIPGANLWPVELDPSQVDQVLANLCVNSRDAIAEAGRITIETSNETIDEAYCAARAEAIPGVYAMLAVSDDGCGMDGKILEHAFEPFTTTKEIGKGTGLGLATVYGIVKQNHGFIHVYSVLGRGTTIRIYLPRYVGTAEVMDPSAVAETPHGRGETVLLAEDEVSLRTTCRIFLEELGYTVLSGETPAHAVELAKKHSGAIDLLLTDVVMPGMNGRQLAEFLRRTQPDLRVLYMSGYTADVIAQHGVLEKGVPFISKPFSRYELARRIRAVLDGAGVAES